MTIDWRQGAVSVLKKGREIALSLIPAEDIPELDDEQLDAGDAMFRDLSKLLWSDPGAGKTLTTCHALLNVEEYFEENEDRQPRVLIAVPPIAVRTWYLWVASTYAAFGHDAVIEVLPTINSPVNDDTTHLIVTYGQLSQGSPRLMATLLKFGADVLICDESDNLVGWESTRTQAVFGLSPLFGGGLAAHVKWAWFLTGTPIPRYNDGVFPVLRSRFKKHLLAWGTATPDAFLKQYCSVELVRYGQMRQAKTLINGSKNEAELKKLIFGGDIPAAVRLKLKLKDRPVFRLVDIDAPPSKTLEALLGELEADAMRQALEGGLRELDGRMATAIRLMGEEVADIVGDYIADELDKKRDKSDMQGILGLFWHRTVGDRLQANLERRGFKVGRIDGRTTSTHDAKMEDAFNAGKIDCLLGQIKSMGVTLNLQANCDHVIFAEETYSHAANLQAYQRVWRRGQTKIVKVDMCRSSCWLADLKPAASARKAASAAKVLD